MTRRSTPGASAWKGARYGKAALVAMAFDQRFAMVLAGCSGEYPWMAGNFLKYGAEKAAFGRRRGGDLPVDSGELIALCAPRLTFTSYGVVQKGDARWPDTGQLHGHGGGRHGVDAARGQGARRDQRLPRSQDAGRQYRSGGQLARRQHDGGHTDTPNMAHFIAWADRNIGRSASGR